MSLYDEGWKLDCTGKHIAETSERSSTCGYLYATTYVIPADHRLASARTLIPRGTVYMPARAAWRRPPVQSKDTKPCQLRPGWRAPVPVGQGLAPEPDIPRSAPKPWPARAPVAVGQDLAADVLGHDGAALQVAQDGADSRLLGAAELGLRHACRYSLRALGWVLGLDREPHSSPSHTSTSRQQPAQPLGHLYLKT